MVRNPCNVFFPLFLSVSVLHFTLLFMSPSLENVRRVGDLAMLYYSEHGWGYSLLLPTF